MSKAYTGGVPAGITVRGVPLSLAYPGKQFWVSSSTTAAHQLAGVKPGSDGGGTKGTYNDPFATIDYAIGRCTASRGDVVFVMPNYTQTIADATSLLFDVAGVAVIGLGVGSSRPTLTFSDATSNIPVSAANMAIQNLLFTVVTAATAVVSFMTVSGTATPTDFTIEKCEFRDVSATIESDAILTDNATAQNLAGLYVADNHIFCRSDTAAATSFKIDTACNRMKFLRNFADYVGIVNTASFLAAGAADHLQLYIGENVMHRGSVDTSSTNGAYISRSATGMTGMVYKNYFSNFDSSTAIYISTGSKLGFNENYSHISGALTGSCTLNPVAV